MTQATDSDTTGPSRSRKTLFYQFYCSITSPRILFVGIRYFKAGTRQPLTASPLPLPSASRAGAGRQPVPAPGHGPARLGPARDVTSRATESRWLRRGGDVIIVRRRSRLAPYPTVQVQELADVQHHHVLVTARYDNHWQNRAMLLRFGNKEDQNVECTRCILILSRDNGPHYV